MRPRFMNRGSDLAHSRLGHSASCFNEAPIHESGKFAIQAGIPKSKIQLQ